MREFYIYTYAESQSGKETPYRLRDTYKQESFSETRHGLEKKILDKYRKQIKFAIQNNKTFLLPYVLQGSDLLEEQLCMLFNENGSDNLYHKRYEKQFLAIQNKDLENRFYDKYLDTEANNSDYGDLTFKSGLSGDIIVSGEINDKEEIKIPINSNIKSIVMSDYAGTVYLQTGWDNDSDKKLKIKDLIVNCPKAMINIEGYDYDIHIKEMICVGLDQRDISDSLKIDSLILNKQENCLKQDLEILSRESKIKYLQLKTDNLIDCYSPELTIDKIDGDSNNLIGSRYHKKSINMIKGKTFVITGSTYTSRPRLTSYIENAGGTVKGSINNTVDYLICDNDESTSTKHREAIRNNVKIIPSTLVKFWLDDCIIH